MLVAFSVTPIGTSQAVGQAGPRRSDAMFTGSGFSAYPEDDGGS